MIGWLFRPPPTSWTSMTFRTASAAEGVVVAFAGRARTRSFGAATYGVPTGNVTYPLPDGFVLAITTSVATDRTGHSYDGPITPTHAGFDPDQAMKSGNQLGKRAGPSRVPGRMSPLLSQVSRRPRHPP